MSKGSSSSTSVTDNTPKPWAPAVPFMKGGLSDLSKWYSSSYGTQPFPGSSVAPMSPYSTQALGMTASRALNGSPLVNASQQQLQSTAQGDYLSPESNPFLRAQYNQGADKLQSQLGSHFNQTGNVNSSMSQGAAADAFNQLASSVYGGAYNDARQNQMQSMLFAPQMAQQDYVDAGQLGNVGGAFEQQAGQNLQDAMNRYNFQQNAPYQRIQNFLNPVTSMASGLPMQSSSQTTPFATNGLSQGLGAAGAIGGLAQQTYNSFPGLFANVNNGVPNQAWFMANPGASAAPFAQSILTGQPLGNIQNSPW